MKARNFFSGHPAFSFEPGTSGLVNLCPFVRYVNKWWMADTWHRKVRQKQLSPILFQQIKSKRDIFKTKQKQKLKANTN